MMLTLVSRVINYMVYQVGGQSRFKGFLANNWLDLDNTS